MFIYSFAEEIDVIFLLQKIKLGRMLYCQHISYKMLPEAKDTL
jgi:hypothetical protein